MKRIFALVDCNNFYVSCERAFDPAIVDKPIVVLSNNDGCIVARSEEVRNLDIPMGAPYYKHKRALARYGVRVYSSNYQLYGDMSSRVMRILHAAVPEVEIYSIDEAFIRLDGLACAEPYPLAVDLRRTILRWLGLPTSIGIAPSKTLAKIASRVAKARGGDGVFDIRDDDVRARVLTDLPIERIWGISRGLGHKLRALGIETARQLSLADPPRIRACLGVVGERIVYELRGIACLDSETDAPKKSIMSSRSFGSPVGDMQSLREALANHAARACEKLREQDSRAQAVCVFIRTHRFQDSRKQYHNCTTIGFDNPTCDTSEVMRASVRALAMLYRTGYRYHKCGLTLLSLTTNTLSQTHLFSAPTSARRERLMTAVDDINRMLGRDSLFYLSQGIERDWRMRCDRRSPRYTTSWDELPQVS